MLFKDTYREKAPSNKTPVLTKSTNMGVWVIGTSNQEVLKLKQNFKKIKHLLAKLHSL